MTSIKAGSSYFLSGVMQGAQANGDGIEGTVSQDYRKMLKDVILGVDSSATIVEPWDLVFAECGKLYAEGTAQSEMFKDVEHVRHCFGVCVDAAKQADVVVTYLPEASMGSAVEIAAAKGAGKLVFAVAPGSMARNWTVQSYADAIFSSVDELHAHLTAVLH